MGRSPCSNKEAGLKKGPWTTEEDQKLVDYIQKNGLVSWKNLPKSAGLNRCGKSCRLRWTNYLRPDIKRGKFSEEEERLTIDLHSVHGNKWSSIATHLSGRTDNEIKNYWNTNLKKKLLHMGIDPVTHRPRTEFDQLSDLHGLLSTIKFSNIATPWHDQHRLLADAAQIAMMQILQTLTHVVTTNGPSPTFDPMDLLQSATLPNFRLNNLIQYLSYQLGSLINDSMNITQNQIPISYGHNNIQASYENEMVSKVISSCPNDGEANQKLNSYSLLDDGSPPSLVSSASLDMKLTGHDHHQQELSKSNSVSADCSNINHFESKEGLGVLNSDRCWNDFLLQISQDCRL